MNLPRMLLLVGLCVALALAFRLDAFASSGPRALWVAPLHGVAGAGSDAVAVVVALERNVANPIVGIAMDTRHGQLWVARRDSLEVRGTGGERLALVDLPDVRQIHALGYDSELDEVWVAADRTLRRFGPNGVQTSSARLRRVVTP